MGMGAQLIRSSLPKLTYSWNFTGQNILMSRFLHRSKIEYSWNFITDLSEPCMQATIKDMDFILYIPDACPNVPSPIHPVYMKAWVYAQLIHSSLSNLGTIPLKSDNLRVKMSYSGWGPSNGQIYKRPIYTGLNHSGSNPIWLGDLPVQLQGLTLCGSVTVGRQNWIFLKF